MRRAAAWVPGLVIAVAGAGCTSSSPSVVTHHQPVASRSTSARPTPSFTPAQSLIERAYWVHEVEGWRIRVMPSIYGRNYAPQAPRTALSEALVAARPTPLHLTPRMRHSLLNQLRCHAEFAPTKPLWDLEAWRPDVGYFPTVAAYCNPGSGA